MEFLMADRFIRERECRELTGLSRTTRWRLERRGNFPKRRKISPNGVAWLLSEISSWQDSRTSDDRGQDHRTQLRPQ